MKALLDTCAISELRKPRPDRGFLAAYESIDDRKLFLSVITIGELTKGISLLRSSKRKSELEVWLSFLQTEFNDRILEIDAEVASVWGNLTASAQRKGVAIGSSDGLIAATAICHGMEVVTRNDSDFLETGAVTFNPWSA